MAAPDSNAVHMMDTIMLVDMDYFYVACEELRHPEIKDAPAIVGSDPKGGSGRGVVMTCNYKAREYGIRSGMPISMAYRIKPDAAYLPLDYGFYESISGRIMDVLRGMAWKFEQVSIDEAFIDVSDRCNTYADAEAYAKKVHDGVFATASIKCSVGVGPNKLVAKIACEKAKPNGIRVVKSDEVVDFLSGCRIDELYGIGKKTEEKLGKLGYKTVKDLANANVMQLVGAFGSLGIELKNYANGIDNRQVEEQIGIKSIGRELTFDVDTSDLARLGEAVITLSNAVIEEARKGNFFFRTVTVKIRYYDFSEHVHSRTVRSAGDAPTLIDVAMGILAGNIDPSKKVRKIGVRISNLVDYGKQSRING